MILLIFFAFLAGFVTVLTPCIWPLLPIVLSGSIGAGHKRPLGITLGVIISFYVFTLFLSYLVNIFHLDPNILRIIAVIILVILGLSLIIPRISAMIETGLSRLSGIFGQRKNSGNGFGSGFITGLSLGIVWAPCAGPILASIVALNAVGKFNLSVVLVSLAYVIGVGIPLFIFSYFGQKLFTKTRFLSKYLEKIQQIFGILVLLMALAIFTHYDTYLESQLLNAFPIFNLNGFESSSVVSNELNQLKGNLDNSNGQLDNSSLFNSNYPAPDFIGITKWLNLPKGQNSLSLKDLKGKVVLVDFWTYTCINCIRTLPHVTTWYDKYSKYGFIVVGIHTPEFEFEHDTNNVLSAIKMYNIHYPVGQDNNYATWNNYNNQYWPAEYLIDTNGVVRRTEFGEGEYNQMETAIQDLLKENGKNVNLKLSNMPDTTPKQELSPETYLGSNRMQYYYPTGSLVSGSQNLTLDNSLSENSFSLGGSWIINGEYAQTGNNAKLLYNFYANNVYLVLNSGQNKMPTVKVLLDGKPISDSQAGADVKNGVVTIDSDRLYNLVNLHGNTSNHILELDFSNAGTQAFAFTFG